MQNSGKQQDRRVTLFCTSKKASSNGSLIFAFSVYSVLADLKETMNFSVANGAHPEKSQLHIHKDFTYS